MSSSDTAGSAVPSSYRNYVAEARDLVRTVIQNAVNIVKAEIKEQQQATEPLPQVDWPCGGDFTIDKGKEAIGQLVKSWHIGSSWKYCIDYLNSHEDMHCYAVKYSEPTRRKPVPKATASVYFYIHVHKQDLPVLVKFIVEGQRTPLTPGDTVFHEIWLRNVLKNKLAISQAAHITC